MYRFGFAAAVAVAIYDVYSVSLYMASISAWKCFCSSARFAFIVGVRRPFSMLKCSWLKYISRACSKPRHRVKYFYKKYIWYRIYNRM